MVKELINNEYVGEVKTQQNTVVNNAFDEPLSEKKSVPIIMNGKHRGKRYGEEYQCGTLEKSF